MHPLTQFVLALGVVALVAIGGYAVVFGVPTATSEPVAIERLRQLNAEADETLCRFNLSRDWSELSRKGRADRVRCLAN
ncbi:hypothetical protein DSS3P1_13 [Ruegeria phage DSS3-P1]|uniref:hypothetical protein n=1 Tax=Ruegeria phage DSS3-P1 TaxID=1555208 RepID=UPI0002357D5A|nr:hypothetical protein DSS3P1_13 [Ruegeria phage DSS3-P1]YP_009997150.1 hypothetical protein JT311_gp16 [Ruegeria phage vB_RpoS-V16]YP_009997229.1 hypothetical protein JT312_gp12 [Ruegeria phage vB_RpoS-V18]YP_009997311.1 hypothetical protein JT313_gp12 [Ruegeria phage vB_RpoS-V11]YP_009997394.1 hypothetical protein JT314_gp13 [Ruegeria phage vB_RpoS-V7]AET42324.1 hypothetical protein SDSG_00059 [Ruegeria phage DSS3-P1]AIT13248.1 hypothetical protein DSS3P1_13 [Ruegeria phage DSS3-P1]AWY087